MARQGNKMPSAERDRLALLMREEGLDYNEIAEALELSPGSVGDHAIACAFAGWWRATRLCRRVEKREKKNAAS